VRTLTCRSVGVKRFTESFFKKNALNLQVYDLYSDVVRPGLAVAVRDGGVVGLYGEKICGVPSDTRRQVEERCLLAGAFKGLAAGGKAAGSLGAAKQGDDIWCVGKVGRMRARHAANPG
jgi:hypothetical protein